LFADQRRARLTPSSCPQKRLRRDPSTATLLDSSPPGMNREDAARTPQHKVLRLRSGFRLRAQTPAKRLNRTDPSTPLRTSARGSDAARTPQLYKKRAIYRNSARRLDFTGVRCLRMACGLFQSASFGENASTQILRLRSGFRLAAQTPRKRLNKRSFDFAPKARRCRQDFACGLPPAVRDHARKTAQQTDPSAPLGISARGSDAARTPQLYKKQASMRKSVNGLDFRAVRCLRIVYGLVSIRKLQSQPQAHGLHHGTRRLPDSSP